MKDITAYLLNYIAPSAGFSLGRLKDNPGDNTGSVVSVATHNDFLYGFYAVILKYLGTVSGTDESESASDMRDALERMAGTVGAKTHIASYNYNQDDVVYREGVIWRANADINTGVDGTTFLLQYAAGKWDSQVSLPDREEIYGGAVTINGVDTQHDVDFASLTCFDIISGDILSGSALTKRIDAAWTVGTNAGMMDTGTVAVSSTYYLYAIKKDSDSSVDYLMSLSSSSPTMPAGYTMKRNIARLITNASANISRIEKVLNPGTKLINEQDIEVTQDFTVGTDLSVGGSISSATTRLATDLDLELGNETVRADTSCANRPDSSQYNVICIQFGASNNTQLAMEIDSVVISPRVWFRKRTAGSWEAWYPIVTDIFNGTLTIDIGSSQGVLLPKDGGLEYLVNAVESGGSYTRKYANSAFRIKPSVLADHKTYIDTAIDGTAGSAITWDNMLTLDHVLKQVNVNQNLSISGNVSLAQNLNMASGKIQNLNSIPLMGFDVNNNAIRTKILNGGFGSATTVTIAHGLTSPVTNNKVIGCLIFGDGGSIGLVQAGSVLGFVDYPDTASIDDTNIIVRRSGTGGAVNAWAVIFYID